MFLLFGRSWSIRWNDSEGCRRWCEFTIFPLYFGMHRLDFQKWREITSVSPDDLRQALRQFASGVTVVTAEHEGMRYGITVSAFTSISIDPPIIMVAINMGGEFAGVITGAEHFAVHILSAGQQRISLSASPLRSKTI